MKVVGRFLRNITASVIIFLMRYVFYRVKIHYEGGKKKKIVHPCVLVSNHLLGMDGAMIACALGKKKIWGCIAKTTYDTWYTRFFNDVGNMIPIDLSSTGIGFMREAKKTLKSGDSVLIFPEGEASHREHGILPFRSGFVFIAQLGGVPVVPLYFTGNYARPLVRRFHLVVGEPIDLGKPDEGESAEEWRERKSEEVRQKVVYLSTLIKKKTAQRAVKRGKINE